MNDYERANYAVKVGLQSIPGDNDLLKLERELRPHFEAMIAKRNAALTTEIVQSSLFGFISSCLRLKGYKFARSYAHEIQRSIKRVCAIS